MTRLAHDKIGDLIIDLHNQGFKYDEMAFITVSVKAGGYYGKFCS